MSKNLNDMNWEIKPVGGWPEFHFKELVRYKDLMLRFVRRDFIISYHQTILGPLWVFLEPLFATFVYYAIFGAVMRVPTDEIPPLVFYLSGIIIWSYFSDSIGAIAYTFVHNSEMFGKVYFPRLIVPVSMLLSKLSRFGIQVLMLILVYLFYKVKGAPILPNIYLLLVPFLIVLTSAFALGFGLFLASLASRYRDVQNLMMFALRLLMFATPVVYPYSLVPQKFKLFIGLNPLTAIIEAFRFALFGTGQIIWAELLYSTVFITLLLFFGIMYFNRVEQNVIDTA